MSLTADAIGKVGFDDELLGTPVSVMSPRQLDIYRKHPQRAEQLLMPLAKLKSTVEIVAAQLSALMARVIHRAWPAAIL